jgi:glycine hydroxymethyltransferase
MAKRSHIEKLIQKHDKYRTEGINLIASENFLSPKVRNALTSDLGSRYHSDWYGGSKYSQQIIEKTEELARKLFGVKYALVTPVSGNICDLAVIYSFTSPKEKVAMLPFTVGGYPLGVKKFDRVRLDIPVNKKSFEIDVERTERLIKRRKVTLTILGSSFIPFPHPVRKLSRYIKKMDFPSHCVFDGSHVMGLVGCGEFQNPLKEGAEVLFGSTHKTLFGPQGGIVLTNSSKHAKKLRSYLDLDLETGIGLIDNPHMHRIAALGLAMEEILKDRDYGRRVIINAQALASSLDELGVPVRFCEKNYTQSHQILLNIDDETAVKLCHGLEEIGVFTDIGGRFGTAEVTHRGMGISEMVMIGEIISQVYLCGPKPKLKKQVKEVARKFA